MTTYLRVVKAAVRQLLYSNAPATSHKLTTTFILLFAAFFATAQGPTFNSTPVTTATVGQPYTYGASATEPSNKPLTISPVTVPSWLTFSSSGQSTSTQFGGAVSHPGGIAGDASGNVYVADLTGQQIYKITPDGTTTPWFKNRGVYIYAMMVHGNDLYVSNFYDNQNYGNGSITKINLTGTPTETTVVAQGVLYNPLSMAYRDGFIYIADYGAGKIRRHNLASKTTTDVATLYDVFGLGFNQSGLLYAASWSYSKVYTINPSVANPQSTLIEKITLPSSASDVKVDANGYVYVSGYGFVRKYTPDLSTYTSAWSGNQIVWGMSLTPGGALVFGLEESSQVHKLQTGATISGTPTINNIGVHAVSIKADNGTTATLQNFNVTVYGPSTFTVSNLTKNVGDAPFQLTDPTSNSSGAFTYTSSNSAVATISGNTVTIVGVGNTTITATQAASGLYLATPKTFTLTVNAQKPVISSFSPTSGPAGTTITIDGSYFTGATAVSIGGVPVTGFTVQSNTRIVATVPAGTINGTIAVTTAAGTGTSSASFSSALPPAITSFAPTSALAGATITITGTNLTGATAVYINDVAVNSFTVVSATSITAVVANNNTTGKIKITTAGGTSITTGNFTVLKNPTISGFATLNKTYGDAPFQLTAPTSNSTGAFTYTSSNTSVATINGSTVTIVGAGSATITATQAADANYVGGSVTAELTVIKAMPVITGFVQINKTYGDAPFVITAPTSTSTGLFNYISSDPSVAMVAGNTITIMGAGTASIIAHQVDDANYMSSSVATTIIVVKATPSISGFSPLAKTYGDAPFNLTTPASNSLGAITYTSGNATVATISGNTVTIAGAGSAVITATQAETPNYKSASVTANLIVSKTVPVVSNFAAITKTYGDAAFTLVKPTSASTGAFTYTSSNVAVATVNGSTVTIKGAGTATITATQAADANYLAATVTAMLTVNKAQPAISGFAAISKTYGDAAFTLVAPTANSTGAFTYTSSNNAVATVNGNTINIVGAGSAVITALQAADANYLSGSVTATLTVAKANPVLRGFVTLNKTYGDAPFVLTAPASISNGNFGYTSSNATVATINGGTVTIAGAGTTTITATQAATDNYNAATANAVLTVGKATPVLSAFAPINKTYGDAAFELTAPTSASNGSFTYTSSNTSVAGINANMVNITGAGTATITATQAETANYKAATITATITVAKAIPAIGNIAAINKTYGDAAFALVAPTSNSTGAFTYSSSNTAVATVNGNTVTIVGAGTATITATQAPDNNYLQGSVATTLTVTKATPAITGFQNLNKTYGDAAFNLQQPQSNSTGVFTYTSSNKAVVTVSGNTITIVGAGTATITATQAADANYNSASVNANITVAKAAPVLANFENLAKTYGDAAFALAKPTSTSPGTFTYTSANGAVATVSGTQATIRGAGTVVITATQAATANYNGGTITASLTVAPKVLTVKAADKVRCVGYTNPEFTYTITGFVRGENASVLQTAPTLTTAANNTSVAGNYAINASGAAAANYTFNYIDGTLRVANPEHTAQRMPNVDALQDEATPLQARSFGVKYQWTPANGLTNASSPAPQARLQDEQKYQVAITEASGCVVVDTVLVRLFERPDVFVPTLFSPNGDGINDVLRLNAVALRSLNAFRIYNQWGKQVFSTNNLNEGWDGTFGGQVQPMATYTWVLSGVDKNGKPITRSGSVTLAR
ncbi:Ig-like domain-containing protein [Paracnuella aquatica]|uniref:Ig-like domain-containing protein n=1 Tax=Paracnuella aquatica TaxID=2268757 RepID=UPI0013900F8E|nr:Ig-like domain-containing protein [Paracnuella aquatica]